MKLCEGLLAALVLSLSYLFPGLQLHRCSKVNNFNSCIFPLGADHVLGLKQSFWLNTVFIISETSYLGAAQVHFTDTASQVQGLRGQQQLHLNSGNGDTVIKQCFFDQFEDLNKPTYIWAYK